MDMNDERVVGEVEVVPGVKIPMVKRGSIKIVEMEVDNAKEKYHDALKLNKKESKENDFEFEGLQRKEKGVD